MSGRKSMLITIGFAVSSSLIAAAVSVLLVSCRYSRFPFELLNVICGELVEQDPEARTIISAALKEYTGGNPDGTAQEDVLAALGYDCWWQP